jgi:hypothetical protein
MWIDPLEEEDEAAGPPTVILMTADSGEAAYLAACAAAYREHAAAAARAAEVELKEAAREIVDAVLDAADLDILEDLDETRRWPADASRLLWELLLDVLRRYRERAHRLAAASKRKEKNHA